MKIINHLFLTQTPKLLLKYGKSSALNLTSNPALDSSVSFLLNDIIPNAWSVNGNTLYSSDIASSLFGFSLFPYLLLLYFLSRSATATPALANKGFQFLLVFVFATIPAGIYAKVAYNDILANVDFLHGGAESFLTITNLLIITGFRSARQKEDIVPNGENEILEVSLLNSFDWKSFLLEIMEPLLILIPLFSILALSYSGGNGMPFHYHTEPSNALSIPTWIVHSSSILEWLLAMKLIWEHSIVSNNPRWKNMTLAMIPSHASGLCACTYHLFYNSPVLIWIVALQALLTVVGNSCMAFAAYRIYQYGNNMNQPDKNNEEDNLIVSKTLKLIESNERFLLNLAAKSIIVALIVKYGELYLDFPFEPQAIFALTLVFGPTFINILKWTKRSLDNNNNKFIVSQDVI
eukprot:gene11458-15350_t